MQRKGSLRKKLSKAKKMTREVLLSKAILFKAGVIPAVSFPGVFLSSWEIRILAASVGLPTRNITKHDSLMTHRTPTRYQEVTWDHLQ